MQFGHALNGALGMPVPGMSQSLNPVEEMDHRFVDLLLSIVFVSPVHRHKADTHFLIYSITQRDQRYHLFFIH